MVKCTLKNKIKIGVFETIYPLFLALLLFDYKEWDIIFIDKYNLKLNITRNNFLKIVTKNRWLKIVLIFFKKIYLLLIFYNKKLEIFGQDHVGLGNILVGMGDFFLIEDGIMNYNMEKAKKIELVQKFKQKIGINVTLGKHQNVKKIYLTGLAPIPKEIAHKVEIINLKELWDKKTLEEQDEILNIFLFDLNIKEKIKGRNIILFTQPLSEDDVITEEEKVKIYSKIIKKYSKDKLIIKTHPREKTDYKNIFQDYLVLDNPFPFEILTLLNIEFNKVVTLFSTAALGLGKEVEVDFYGTEVHMKILERFGSCDYIMKRNCFLEEE